MSGELRTSQFRWTTTADDDFVIGNPSNIGTADKALVFQTTTTPGTTTNPHLKCEYVSPGNWSFVVASVVGGVLTPLSLSGMAYLASTQVFSGTTNTFSNDVIIGGDLTVTGTISGPGMSTGATGATGQTGAGNTGATGMTGMTGQTGAGNTGVTGATGVAVSGVLYEQSGTGNTSVVIPEGIIEIEITLQAAGGDGGSGVGNGGMGGSGGTYIRRRIPVKPHNTYSIGIAAVGSNSTFSWVSFDSAPGFTSDSGFGTITATCGADGGTGSDSGTDGASNTNPYETPENGWNLVGASGGDNSTAATFPAGAGGSVGLKAGGSGSTWPTAQCGGGGGASAMGNGGSGGHGSGFAGTLGGGGGGRGSDGGTPGAGGTGYGRARW